MYSSSLSSYNSNLIFINLLVLHIMLASKALTLTAKSMRGLSLPLPLSSNIPRLFTSSSINYSSNHSNSNSSSSNSNAAPDSFYDEKMESEREFEDIASSIILNGGIEKLTSIKVSV